MGAFFWVEIALLWFYYLFTDNPFTEAQDEDEEVYDEEKDDKTGQDEEDYEEEQAADADDENSSLMGKGQKSSCTQYASLPTVHTLPYILWVTQIKENNNGFYLLWVCWYIFINWRDVIPY